MRDQMWLQLKELGAQLTDAQKLIEKLNARLHRSIA